MKKVVSFTLILAMCLTLSACGSSTGPEALPSPEVRETQTIVSTSPIPDAHVSEELSEESSEPEPGNANLTAQKLLSDPDRYAGKRVTVEGFVSSKVNTVSQDGSSWSYYRISVVDDRAYVVGNVLQIRNKVTPTYDEAKWLKEAEDIGKGDYGLIFTISAADYDLIRPGDRIVLSGYAWKEGTSPVMESTYGNYYASHYLSSGKLLEILSTN